MNWSSASPLLDGNFDEVVARLAGTGRASVERHLIKCEKDAQHLLLWKYLVGFFNSVAEITEG